MLAADQLDEGLALCQALGGYWLSQGFLVEAEQWLARFLEHADRVHWATLADSLHVAGRIAEYRGAYALAQSQHLRSLNISREHGDATRAARALCGIAAAEIHQAEYAPAQQHLQEALAFARRSESLPELAQALLALGRIADLQGDTARAGVYRDECLQIHRQLGDEWGIAYVLNELGQQARREGRLERAQTMLEECLILWRKSGSRMGERSALMNLAAVTFERGLLARSATLARESIDVCRDLADASATTARCLEIASQVIYALAPAETAVSLIAAAAAQREALGAPVPPQEQTEIERTLSASRASLNEQVFQQAWQRGEHLTAPQALELAAASLAQFVESPVV